MSDLTLVLGPEWSRFSKKINTVDDIQAADGLPSYLEFDTADVTDVDDLFEILNALRSERNTCVIRGQLLPNVEQPCRRLLKERTEEGVHYPATFEDVPRTWLMVDFDSVPEPGGVDFASQPARCASYLRMQLPSPFHTARCVWHASGSAGFKPGIRLHLWFLLDRGLTGDECKAWLSHATLPVDRTVYGAVQPHFTADPLIVGEQLDPMSERLGLLEGSHERVVVPAELPADLKLDSKVANKRMLADVRDTRDMDPFVRVGLQRWENDHPWDGGAPDLSERFECPACGSSDGCAMLPDGKLFCHGGKHSNVAPTVGHVANNGYVMHRFEAFEKLAWRDVPRRLQELGYYPGAPAARTRQVPVTSNTDSHPLMDDAGELAAVESAVSVMSAAVEGTPTLVSFSKVKRARKELLECAKCISTDPAQAEALAFDFARKHVPAHMTPSAVRRGLIDNARLFDESVERAIDRGIERAATTPHEETVSAVSLDMYGKAEKSIANVTKLLHLPDFADTLAFDVRGRKVVLTGQPPWLADGDTYPRELQDTDYPAIAVYLADRLDYARATVGDIQQAVPLVALGNSYDPVVEYLDALPAWESSLEDAREACGSWLVAFAGAPDDAYTHAVSMRWLISAVARAYEPGCQQREVLTLIGPQNIGKSKLLGALAGRKWFKDDLNLQRSPEMALLGSWIVELAEVDKLTAQDRHGDLKALISTEVDHYRAPYAHNFVSVPRRSVFAGTANPEQIFRDPTGNTRFNVVVLGAEIDFAGAGEARNELWSAARMLYKAGEPWHLQADEKMWAVERQEVHRERWDGEEYLRELLENPVVLRPGDPSAFRPLAGQLDERRLLQWITTTQLVDYLRTKDVRRNIHKQVAQAMELIGWARVRHVGGDLHTGPRGYSKK